MRADLEIPARYGIRQSVGDTSGPGGLSRALRNIPVVAEMAARIDRLCPEAIVLNYTNPLTVLTQTLAMLRSKKARTIGLCHEWYYVRGRLAALLGIEKGQIQARVAGINHLIWMTEMNVAGRDAWGDLRRLVGKILSAEIDADPSDNSVFADKARVKARLFQLYGALPVAGDRHIAEFFPHFINEATRWGADFGIHLTDVEYRRGMETTASSRISSMLADKKQLERFMHTRSIEAAADIIAAVTKGGRYEGLLNLPNAGQISNLPQGAVIETHGVVGRTGAHALTYGDLPSGIQTVVERHVRNQELTVQAALKGDRCLALQVLLNDPLSSRLTVDQADTMLTDLLAANRDFLPQFH
jgi:alpha-galactosidase